MQATRASYFHYLLEGRKAVQGDEQMKNLVLSRLEAWSGP